MQAPPQIVLHHVSEAVGPYVGRWVQRLERYSDRITACRVLVERPHRRHREGNLYLVRVEIEVPGRVIVVKRDPPSDRSREDVRAALRDAFDAARRRLEDWARERRGDVKAHAARAHGRVVRLHPAEGYGFLRAADGHEVYFRRSSVLDGSFDDLRVGSALTFDEEPGDEGPQAASVRRAFGPEHVVE